MLVIDKPAGLPVHKGPKGGETLDQHFEALRFGMASRPQLAHRLDRDTSGCLVLGRHPKALRQLGGLFAQGRVEKIYWAVVEGTPAEPEGRIELPLGRRSSTPHLGAAKVQGWWMKVDEAGDPAATDYRVLGSADGLSWIEARPLTGRTHQIRVHLAALGCPILGDGVYGRRHPGVTMHLHAREVAVPLHPRREPVRVEAPVPAHMRDALERLGLAGLTDPAPHP